MPNDVEVSQERQQDWRFQLETKKNSWQFLQMTAIFSQFYLQKPSDSYVTQR